MQKKKKEWIHRNAMVQISTKKRTMVISVIKLETADWTESAEGSSSSNTFPLPDFLFYIHWLGRNLDNVDILILRLNLTKVSRILCSSFSKIGTCVSHICSSVHAASTRRRGNGSGIRDRDRSWRGIEHHHHCMPTLGTSSNEYWSFGKCTWRSRRRKVFCKKTTGWVRGRRWYCLIKKLIKG